MRTISGIIGFLAIFSSTFVSSGCASSPDLNIKREPQAQVDPLPGKSVEERLRYALDARLKAGFGFGYVAALREGGNGATLTLGKKTLEPVTPLAASDVTALGSISKTFTGILVHLAIVDGKLKLDTRLEEVIPELKGLDTGGITIQELGLHQSGLKSGPGLSKDPENPWKEIADRELVDALRSYTRPALPAGSSSYSRKYSNWGYMTLGMVLKKVYGRSFADLLKNRILVPLKMSSTGIELTTRKKRKEVRKQIPGFELNADLKNAWNFSDVAATTGGIESTASDMAKFLAALENPSAIRNAPKLAQAMADSMKSGIGWDSLPGELPLRKNGSIISHTSILVLDPVGLKSVFVGTNSASSPDGAAKFAVGAKPTDEDLIPAIPGRVVADEELNRLKGFYTCKMPIPDHPAVQSIDASIFEVFGRTAIRFHYRTKTRLQVFGGMLVSFSKPDIWTYLDESDGGAVQLLENSVRMAFLSGSSKMTFECAKQNRPPEAYPALEK